MRSRQKRNCTPQTPALPGFVVSGIPKMRGSTGSAPANGTAPCSLFERVQIIRHYAGRSLATTALAADRRPFERVQTAGRLNPKCTCDTPFKSRLAGAFERVQMDGPAVRAAGCRRSPIRTRSPSVLNVTLVFSGSASKANVVTQVEQRACCSIGWPPIHSPRPSSSRTPGRGLSPSTFQPKLRTSTRWRFTSWGAPPPHPSNLRSWPLQPSSPSPQPYQSRLPKRPLGSLDLWSAGLPAYLSDRSRANFVSRRPAWSRSPKSTWPPFAAIDTREFVAPAPSLSASHHIGCTSYDSRTTNRYRTAQRTSLASPSFERVQIGQHRRPHPINRSTIGGPPMDPPK
jgi:hypothetical protein